MSAQAMERTPVMGLAAMMRAVEAALRDGTWKHSPIGSEVEAYLRSLRWANAPATTMEAYTYVLGLLALRHADWEEGLAGFCTPAGPEYLREFLDAEWGGSSAATKRQRTSIVRALFKWAALERRIPYDPAATLRSPKGRNRAARQAYPLPVLQQLVSAQESLRDQVACQFLCRLGLRKNELRLIQWRDIDLVRGYVLVHGKGGKDELMPLKGSLAEDVRLLNLETSPRPDWYLLFPRGHKSKPMNPASVHRWFKRCLKTAGLPETLMIHEMRHSAADAVYRERGDVAMAQQLLRHESLSTTQAYLHPTKRDLADTLMALDAVWEKG